MNEALEARFSELEERLRGYMPNMDAALLRAAFDFAVQAHDGQNRKDGTPFVTHPLEVAMITADFSLDMDGIIATLLHDTIEDTPYKHEDIKARFGAVVAGLVDGVTKLTRVPYSTKEEQQMENLRKMFLAMARDIRVILIKIADRLHNMRTLEYHAERRRREISLETMEIYAPLAHRLGMQKMKWELEDLSLQNLDPIGYQEITVELKNRLAFSEGFLEQVQARLEEHLAYAEIHAHIYGRIKHIYSVYRKMYNLHKAIFEIYDLYAVRIIVDNLADCYNALGFVHDLFKPIPGRFKDYISTPKPNMYQSLHTTVIGREGIPFEVQIRTWDMHHTAEYGIAAHWKYKQGLEDGAPSGLDQKLEWVRRLLDTQQDTEAEDFIRNLKIDMFADEVFVFTPLGDVINLPAGASPIDFAYAIHSAVGNRLMGVKVNGRMVSLDYSLQNGDIVEIITGNTGGPSRDWMNLVKTGEARNKIKQWFKKERREENIAQGKQELEQELRRAGIVANNWQKGELLTLILRKLSVNTLDDLYAALGYGGISVNRAVNRIRDELTRVNSVTTDKSVMEKVAKQQKPTAKPTGGVLVEGMEGCLMKFARCCAPVPGDDIIGFVTRGYGVSIHRTQCPNVTREAAGGEGEEGRWVQVSWGTETLEHYQAALTLLAREREGFVVEVVTMLQNSKIAMQKIEARLLGDGNEMVYLILQVKDQAHLQEISQKLKNLHGVAEVRRESIH